MRLLALSLLLVASASAAQEAPADSTHGGLAVEADVCEPVVAREGAVLYGRITEVETGEPFVGANVVLPNLQRGAATDIDGCYLMFGLPEGTYRVQVSFYGYRSVERDEVELKVGEPSRLNAELEFIPLDELSCGGFSYLWPPLVSREVYDVRTITATGNRPEGCFRIGIEDLPTER